MAQSSFVEEYNALFVRFMKHIAQLNMGVFLMSMEGRPYRFDTQNYILSNPDLECQFKEWPEWVALDKKVQECGGKPLIFSFVFGYQFSYLVNTMKLIKTQKVPKFDGFLPHLALAIKDHTILNNTLLRGEMLFEEVAEKKYVILIQGLKVSGRLEMEGCGYFDAIPEQIRDYPMFWIEGIPNHLYSVFYVERRDILNKGFLCRLMASIRTYEEADVRFDRILSESIGITGRLSYSSTNLVSSYREDTAIFGTEPPRLMEIDLQKERGFICHVEQMMKGLVYMDVCCEYYNYSRLAPKHLQIPIDFIAIESAFPSDSHNKQDTLSRILRYILDEDKKFSDLIKKYYRLRNSVVHGNQEKRRKVHCKLGQFPGSIFPT